MERIKQFVTTNPLLAIAISLAIVITIYLFASAAWSGAKIAVLERKNAQLTQEGDRLNADLQKMQDTYNEQQGVIRAKEQELTEKDELLKAFTKQVADNKVALNNATTTYNNLRNDNTPMSSTELHNRLCQLYPNECK